MHPVMLQTGRCQNVLEFLPDRRLGIVAAIRMIEHQAGEFTLIPQVAHLALLCLLIRFVLLQHFHHEGGRGNHTGFAVLQGSEYIILTLDPRLYQLLLDVYHTWCEENAYPALKSKTLIEQLVANQEKYGIQYTTHLINSAGRQVRGFKGIGSLIKTSGYSSGGWQQVDPDDNPFKT